jgi:hypothetical protein
MKNPANPQNMFLANAGDLLVSRSKIIEFSWFITRQLDNPCMFNSHITCWGLILKMDLILTTSEIQS